MVRLPGTAARGGFCVGGMIVHRHRLSNGLGRVLNPAQLHDEARRSGSAAGVGRHNGTARPHAGADPLVLERLHLRSVEAAAMRATNRGAHALVMNCGRGAFTPPPAAKAYGNGNDQALRPWVAA